MFLVFLGVCERHIPIFFVASVAEELLVYTNTVPEWLCTARQEKVRYENETCEVIPRSFM